MAFAPLNDLEWLIDKLGMRKWRISPWLTQNHVTEIFLKTRDRLVNFDLGIVLVLLYGWPWLMDKLISMNAVTGNPNWLTSSAKVRLIISIYASWYPSQLCLKTAVLAMKDLYDWMSPLSRTFICQDPVPSSAAIKRALGIKIPPAQILAPFKWLEARGSLLSDPRVQEIGVCEK